MGSVLGFDPIIFTKARFDGLFLAFVSWYRGYGCEQFGSNIETAQSGLTNPSSSLGILGWPFGWRKI